MARQARSEATRRKILDAAVALFSEVGFAATGLGDIIERADLTKGALYYHFDSKEALAAEIIEEATAAIFDKLRTTGDSSAPAMEILIHSSFAVAHMVTTDPTVRTGRHLTRTLGEFNDVVTRSYRGALDVVSSQLTQAVVDGDLRAGLDPDAAAEALLSAYLGAESLSGPTGNSDDLIGRLTRIWNLVLPAIAAEDALPFLQEFLSREAFRQRQPALSVD